jgi:protein-disulfide isomerase
MKKDWLVNSMLVILTACAVIVTGLLVRRELSGGDRASTPVEKVRDWKRYASAGQRIGPADAKLVLVEFSDFQCPYCKQVHDDLEAIRARHPDEVAILYRHYPLDAIHPHARSAALASECAAAQGHFEAFHDAVFERQDSIGTIAWSEFARRAGVPSVPAFDQCVAEKRHAPRIEEDMAAARRLEITGTPLLLIRETRIGGALPREELQRRIDAALRQ